MSASRRNPVDHEVLEPIAGRWSPIGFDGRPVEREKLLRALEAGRWASSSFNEQPWRVILQTRDEEAGFTRALDCLVEGNRVWAQRAGALLFLCARRRFEKNGRDNAHAWFDTGQFLAHLLLQLTADGLHAHPMAGFDEQRARETFGIPDEYDPVCALAVGVFDPDAPVPEGHEGRDQAPRVRRPLADLVFSDRFESRSPIVD